MQKKAVKIGKKRLTPWYRRYDPLLDDRSLNQHLDSDKELIEARSNLGRLTNEIDRAYETYEQFTVHNNIDNARAQELFEDFKKKESDAGAAYDTVYEKSEIQYR